MGTCVSMIKYKSEYFYGIYVKMNIHIKEWTIIGLQSIWKSKKCMIVLKLYIYTQRNENRPISLANSKLNSIWTKDHVVKSEILCTNLSHQANTYKYSRDILPYPRPSCEAKTNYLSLKLYLKFKYLVTELKSLDRGNQSANERQ